LAPVIGEEAPPVEGAARERKQIEKKEWKEIVKWEEK